MVRHGEAKPDGQGNMLRITGNGRAQMKHLSTLLSGLLHESGNECATIAYGGMPHLNLSARILENLLKNAGIVDLQSIRLLEKESVTSREAYEMMSGIIRDEDGFDILILVTRQEQTWKLPLEYKNIKKKGFLVQELEYGEALIIDTLSHDHVLHVKSGTDPESIIEFVHKRKAVL
jgi:hypothetical protein